MNFREILGLKFVSSDFDEFVRTILQLMKSRKSITIFPVSVNVLVTAKKDPDFFSILNKATFLPPDGMPLLWAGKFLKKKLKTKISGADLFPILCKTAAQNRYKVFLLGAEEGVAVKAAGNLMDVYPSLEVVGTYSPFFGFEKNEEENRKIVKMIKEKNPDFLFVAFGAPKQEKWIWKYKNELSIPVLMAVGASFDFTSGNLKRAPMVLQKIGLEWFWRLIMEPRRLWKRYLFDAFNFLFLVLKARKEGRDEIRRD